MMVPGVTQKFEALDKDNVYYKQTNRNLKRKLKEILNSFDSEKQVWYCILQHVFKSRCVFTW